MRARALERVNAAWPRRADQEPVLVKGLWSALQTHLQGVNWATLAIMPEKIRHRAALLSCSSSINVTRLAEEGKPELRLPHAEGTHVAAPR
jgi:hypothetical protein